MSKPGETVVGFVDITPQWENTALYFAEVLRDHGFTKGADDPIISFIEMIRHQTLNDPEAVERLLKKLNR